MCCSAWIAGWGATFEVGTDSAWTLRASRTFATIRIEGEARNTVDLIGAMHSARRRD